MNQQGAGCRECKCQCRKVYKLHLHVRLQEIHLWGQRVNQVPHWRLQDISAQSMQRKSAGQKEVLLHAWNIWGMNLQTSEGICE